MLYIPILRFILSLNHEEILVMTYHLRVDGRLGAPAERQEMDCIQEIGFTHAILTQQTIHLG
jgi:hypothetical protein